MKSYTILLSTLVMGIIASPQASPSAIAKCQSWCNKADFPDQCRTQAQTGTGPCFECGPNESADSKLDLCDGKCKNIKTDASNCGRCGNECEFGKICRNGICGCSAGTFYCPKINQCVSRNYHIQLGDCGCYDICP